MLGGGSPLQLIIAFLGCRPEPNRFGLEDGREVQGSPRPGGKQYLSPALLGIIGTLLRTRVSAASKMRRQTFGCPLTL